MAKDEAPTDSIKADDAIFMAECLKHLQTPANIDIKSVAAALKYKNSASVANRIRVLKKKFDLNVGCTTAASGDGPTAAAANTPRKGAAANRGPAKATAAASDDAAEAEPKAGSGTGAKRGRAPRKRAAKSAAKAKDSTDEAEEEED